MHSVGAQTMSTHTVDARAVSMHTIHVAFRKAMVSPIKQSHVESEKRVFIVGLVISVIVVRKA